MAQVAQVLAAISVKSTLRSDSLQDACENLHSVRALALAANQTDTPWCAAFFFGIDPALDADPGRIHTLLQRSVASLPALSAPIPPHHPYSRGIDMICTAERFAALMDYSTTPFTSRIHDCGSAATSAFLGNLLSYIAATRGAPSTSFSDLVASAPVVLPPV